MIAQPDELAVHIVDDDEVLRDSLEFLFASRGLITRSWPSGEAFLAAWPQSDCGCIVLDVRMEGISGPLVLDALVRSEGSSALLPPVIFLTGHADVPMAVQSLKNGAFDFLEKPFNDNQIVDLAINAMQLHRSRAVQSEGRAGIAARRDTLSARETEVLSLILEGQQNKQIAERLGIAVRTVEVHRARVMQKIGARSPVELAHMLARLN